jgi:hypothetical protein
MNSGAIWTVLWRAIGLVSLCSAIFVCALVGARRRWPTVAVRAVTAIGLIVGAGLSVWLVFSVAESPVRVPQGDDRWVHEIWIHPSPVLAVIPVVVGTVAGGIYSLYLRRREGGRVA